MNDLFVNIKVDREERPDVDAIYMAALHELGEQGGWPLTMFLTSDAEPFWGGTYFPKDARYGRPAFTHVLKEIARIYRDEQAKVRQNADTAEGPARAEIRAGPGRDPGRRGTRRSCAAPARARRSAPWRHQRRAEISAAAIPEFPVARRTPLRPTRSAPSGDAHPHPYRARRHLRSSRRRLRPLQRGRALARAAFREDALRQRAAARADDRGLARDEVAALCHARARHHRLAAPRDAERRRVRLARSTPTARARRASSMCGAWPRSKTFSARTTPSSSPKFTT